MLKMKPAVVRRTKRTDLIIHLRHRYEGSLGNEPRTYNKIYADVLRKLADAMEEIYDAFVDPEVVIWMHRPGEITAEVPLSPIE